MSPRSFSVRTIFRVRTCVSIGPAYGKIYTILISSFRIKVQYNYSTDALSKQFFGSGEKSHAIRTYLNNQLDHVVCLFH
jgi:hypothetical protein